jgi:hypothetical protein
LDYILSTSNQIQNTVLDVCTHLHKMLATVMTTLLFFDFYSIVFYLDKFSEGILTVYVRDVWTMCMLISNMTRILTLIFTVTRNRYHTTIVLCLLSRVDNNLFLIN